MDIFEREEQRDPSASGHLMGGAMENIDRLVGSGESSTTCPAWVLVGETWFIVADDEAALDSAEQSLGGSVRTVEPASPPFSYAVPGCD
jgi:hypothetical protein